uniref:Uncharacterized protein n=1 Tax=Romanomermis culicivorax TaxID=13658 RepID=A0A915IHM7_ROMCU
MTRLLRERELSHLENCRQDISDAVILNNNDAVTVENSKKFTTAPTTKNFPAASAASSSSFKLELDENYDID